MDANFPETPSLNDGQGQLLNNRLYWYQRTIMFVCDNKRCHGITIRIGLDRRILAFHQSDWPVFGTPYIIHIFGMVSPNKPAARPSLYVNGNRSGKLICDATRRSAGVSRRATRLRMNVSTNRDIRPRVLRSAENTPRSMAYCMSR